MSRYIDADLLLAKCRRNPLFEKTLEDTRMVYVERSVIDSIPTADVVEVRHGEWKDRYENKYANHLYECSLCGEIAPDGVKRSVLGNPEIIQVLSPYCPTCGAKMDGKGREG